MTSSHSVKKRDCLPETTSTSILHSFSKGHILSVFAQRPLNGSRRADQGRRNPASITIHVRSLQCISLRFVAVYGGHCPRNCRIRSHSRRSVTCTWYRAHGRCSYTTARSDLSGPLWAAVVCATLRRMPHQLGEVHAAGRARVDPADDRHALPRQLGSIFLPEPRSPKNNRKTTAPTYRSTSPRADSSTSPDGAQPHHR